MPPTTTAQLNPYRPTRRMAPPRGQRRASSIIEMAIVFQVLMWIAMGMAEYGQYFYIRAAFVSAARDAARAAILSTAATADPTTAATRTLGYANVTFQSSWMTITNITGTPYTVTDVTTQAPGQALQIQISTTYTSIPNVFRPLNAITGQGIKNGKTVSGTCTMIRE